MMPWQLAAFILLALIIGAFIQVQIIREYVRAGRFSGIKRPTWAWLWNLRSINPKMAPPAPAQQSRQSEATPYTPKESHVHQ